jgi:dienelactone hydrolase
MLRATRQALADFHALARWAREQGCADIAIWGFSLGAWLAGLYLCRTDLASRAILTTPVVDLARGVRELAFCHPVRAALAGENLNLSTLNLTAHQPRIPPERILICQSSYDLFVPSETFDQLACAWRIPRVHTCPQSHLSVLLSRRSMRVSLNWLAEQFAPSTLPARPPAAVSAAA